MEQVRPQENQNSTEKFDFDTRMFIPYEAEDYQKDTAQSHKNYLNSLEIWDNCRSDLALLELETAEMEVKVQQAWDLKEELYSKYLATKTAEEFSKIDPAEE